MAPGPFRSRPCRDGFGQAAACPPRSSESRRSCSSALTGSSRRRSRSARGSNISAYRLISPPIDEPMMPVASRSTLVGNERSTSGMTEPTNHSRYISPRPPISAPGFHGCGAAPRVVLVHASCAVRNRDGDGLDPLPGEHLERLVGVPLPRVGGALVEDVLAVVEVHGRVAAAVSPARAIGRERRRQVNDDLAAASRGRRCAAPARQARGP